MDTPCNKKKTQDVCLCLAAVTTVDTDGVQEL